MALAWFWSDATKVTFKSTVSVAEPTLMVAVTGTLVSGCKSCFSKSDAV